MADSPKTDKITDKIATLSDDASYFSLEFFPPKTAMGTTNLRARLDRMARALRPLFVTVTWGAGGSTASRSLELAELCQRDLGLTTCLHLTCTNMSKALVDEALKAAKEAGIQNILALRGDEPRGEYKDALGEGKEGEDEFVWAIDLVRYIRRNYGDYFCVGVAAYPEGHADGSHPTEQSLQHDLPYLVDKVQAGADFIMTQLFYDVDAYDKCEKTLREHSSGTFKSIPIIPGLMPIQSYQILRRTTKLSNAKLPESIVDRLDAVRGDDEMVKKVGVDILAEIVESVKAIKARTHGPKGFHFYTLNLEKAVAFILECTNLIPSFTPVLISDVFAIDDITDTLPLPQLLINGEKKNRRQSSVGSGPHNFVIIDREEASGFETTGAEAAVPKEGINTRANTLAISEGEGALGREATWDEYDPLSTILQCCRTF
jgi:methylenetetrahydrofolate reductase (NADPH)